MDVGRNVKRWHSRNGARHKVNAHSGADIITIMIMSREKAARCMLMTRYEVQNPAYEPSKSRYLRQHYTRCYGVNGAGVINGAM